MSQILDQLTLNIKLEDSISLDKFIVCESNKHSLQFIENSLTGDSISNLFYIWGEEGVGKSYLMKAINKEYRKLNKKTFHLSLENSKALSHTILEDLSFMDVILIERIDCMLNDIEWENKIFSLINGALNSNLRIYISSNVVAKDLDIGLKDLTSRLSYFTGIEIPEISQREKIEAIKQSATRKGLKLDDSTINYILNHTSRSLTDLLRLLGDLDSYSLKKKRKINISLVSQMLRENFNNSHK